MTIGNVIKLAQILVRYYRHKKNRLEWVSHRFHFLIKMMYWQLVDEGGGFQLHLHRHYLLDRSRDQNKWE